MSHFDNTRNIETEAASQTFAALAHPARLEIFRNLVRASPQAIPAGQLADELAIPTSTLSFHLKELSRSHLVTSRRESRSILYSVAPETVSELIAFFVDDCCQGRAELCNPINDDCC